MRYRSGISLLVAILLLLFGLDWSRSLPRSHEVPPAPVISMPYVLDLDFGFADPGVHQFSDAQTPRSVIQMTHLPLTSGLRDDPCLDVPLASGAALDIRLNNATVQDVVVFWMPAGERMALGIPLHPDRMARQDWEDLPGIGPALAQRIDLDRQKNGDFVSLQTLIRVPGVGEKRLAAWKDYFEK